MTSEPGEARSGDDELLNLLREAQFVMIKHPIAAQAVFRAFVAEGRAFAKSAEGEMWRRRLVDSELIRRGRVVWEVASLNLLEEEPRSVLPSQLLEAVALAAKIPDLEPKLSRLFESTGGEGGERAP